MPAPAVLRGSAYTWVALSVRLQAMFAAKPELGVVAGGPTGTSLSSCWDKRSWCSTLVTLARSASSCAATLFRRVLQGALVVGEAVANGFLGPRICAAQLES